METPRYKVTENAFFAPNFVLAGSIIETEAPPGPHLVPLNHEAAVKMEAWLSEEVDELDPKTRQPTGKKIRPHERYRRRAYVSSEQQTAEVISGPTRDDVVGKSLSEIQAERKSTDQRPAPSKALKNVPKMEDLLAEKPAEPSAAVIEAAKPPIQATKSVPG